MIEEKLDETQWEDLRHRIDEISTQANVVLVTEKIYKQKLDPKLEKIETPHGNLVLASTNHLCYDPLVLWLAQTPRSEEDLNSESFRDVLKQLAEISLSEHEYRQAFPVECMEEEALERGEIDVPEVPVDVRRVHTPEDVRDDPEES